ncbi:MAG: DUF58 domain-containing protein [Spirochaetales bacterium]|nr:DUF58 domain-containing protein [Spirochaetales bacterium]
MNVFSVAERARYLHLSALSLAEGMRSGGFRSCFRGRGMDVDGVREYAAGDDIRSIDWNVMARTGKPHVKMYREERDLTVYLVVDDSLSMASAWKGLTKKNKALECAALLAFAAERNTSPVGLISFDRDTGRVFAPKTGRKHIMTVLSDLERRVCSLSGSALSQTLSLSLGVLKNRSLVIVISDFRIAGYEDSLAALARRHDVLAVRLVSPVDFFLPNAGLCPFRDPETGFETAYPTASPSFAQQWEMDAKESVQRWKTTCLKRGALPLVLSVEDDAFTALSSFFKNNPSSLYRDAGLR